MFVIWNQSLLAFSTGLLLKLPVQVHESPCLGSLWLPLVDHSFGKKAVMDDELEDRSLLETRTTRPRQGKWTFWLVYATTVCVGGSSFQFGYNTSCINAPQKVKCSLVVEPTFLFFLTCLSQVSCIERIQTAAFICLVYLPYSMRNSWQWMNIQGQ